MFAKNEFTVDLRSRRKKRLRDIEYLVKAYKNTLGITKIITIKEEKNEKGMVALVSEGKPKALRVQLKVNRGVLEKYAGTVNTSLLTQPNHLTEAQFNVYLRWLIAHEMIHVKFNDIAISSGNWLKNAPSNQHNFIKLLGVLQEIRADILGSKLAGILTSQQSICHFYHGTKSMQECFNKCHVDKTTRLHFSTNYTEFDQVTLMAVVGLYSGTFGINIVDFLNFLRLNSDKECIATLPI